MWFRSNHQVGLTVHGYAEHGDGLLIVADQPAIAGGQARRRRPW